VPSSIWETKRRHTDALMAMAGVLAVGIGEGPNGHEAIVVSVRRGYEKAAASVPAEIEGHAVVVRVTQEMRAQ